MLGELFRLPEDPDKPLPLGEWFFELIWCPSQCYYHLQNNGIDYILYLRWRHEDPWQGSVIKNATNLDDMHKDDAIWSEDIFQIHAIQFKDEEIELAKAKITSMFYEFNGKFPERKRFVGR